MPKKRSFHRPAAGEALFKAEKDPKRLAPGARRLGSCLADPLRILAAAGRRRTRTSMCSNSGAYSLRLPAMLAALYGALSHLARASMRYSVGSPFHPTATAHFRFRARDRACTWHATNHSGTGGAH
jgi:hypothetical protein